MSGSPESTASLPREGPLGVLFEEGRKILACIAVVLDSEEGRKLGTEDDAWFDP